jgi:hypothetical protein
LIIAINYCNVAQAQWAGSTVSTNTNSDVTIQTTSPQGNLTIFRNIPTQASNVITYPKPALSILQHQDFLNGTSCIGCTYANTPQSIFEVMGASYTNGNGGSSAGAFIGYNTPIFTIGGDCQMKLGGLAKPSFNNAIYGQNYFDGNTLLKGKVRLTNNNTTIASPFTSFPYTFSVDNGDSRFLGNIEVAGNGRVEGTLRLGPTAANATYANYRLSVDGDIICKRAVVQTSNWADYVFNNDYKLIPLNEVEDYINANNHLPNMPAEKEVVANGQDVAELQKLQQAKIEELTLYIISLQKQIDELKNK